MFSCCSHSFTIDSQTKTYELLEQVGKGAYCIVKKCKCLKDNKYYALKIINKKQMHKIHAEEQIINEIKLLMKLKHINVLRIEECFEDHNNVYMVLEYCSLGNLLSIKQQFKEEQLFKYIYQINEGLIYLHQLGIIHRDIKPQNILLTQDQIVKIVDFNWSTHYKPYQISTEICGTTEYMPPEVFTSRAHTPKLDVWSLGVLFYQIVFGQLPFTGKNEKDTISLIMNHNPFSQYMGSVPEDMMILMMQMLNKNVELRPTSLQITQSPWFQKHLNYYLYTNTSSDSFREIITQRENQNFCF